MSEPIQAIAQNSYSRATRKEVSHENTLSGNGTVESALGVVRGYNETGVWSGNYTGTKTKQFNLTESYKNFEELEIWWANQPGAEKRGVIISRYPNDSYQNAWFGFNACSDNINHIAYKICFLSAISNTQLTTYNYRQAATDSKTTANFVWGRPQEYYECYPVKIIGINRIANS